MKALKLLLVGAVIVGLLVVIFSWKTITESIIGPPKKVQVLNKLRSDVDKDWDNASEWNQEVYEQNMREAKTRKNELEKEAAGNFNTLKNYTDTKVKNKLVGFVKKELALSKCSQSKIGQLKAGLDYIVSQNKELLADDPDVKETYAKITLYNNILSFGKKNISLAPGFMFYSGSWNDFDTYRNQQILQRENFKKNLYYGSVSHIDDVKTSLSSLDGKLASAETAFQKKLSSAIIAAYEKAERTPENQKELQSVYNKYYGKNYEDGKRLSNFRSRFIEEVNQEEARKAQSSNYR